LLHDKSGTASQQCGPKEQRSKQRSQHFQEEKKQKLKRNKETHQRLSIEQSEFAVDLAW
jgi:hypothetical protein